MARYIEVDELLNRLPNDLPYKASVKRVLTQAPTADVVPKSEVDLYRKQVDELEDELATTYDKLEKARAEVAREIFEELEFDIHQLMFERDETRAIAIEGVIAALKKKYTEVE